MKLNQKLLIVTILVFLSSLTLLNSASAQPSNSEIYGPSYNPNDYLIVTTNSEGLQKSFNIPVKELTFNIIPRFDAAGNFMYNTVSPNPNLQSFYEKVGFHSPSQKVVVVYPLFTKAAYGDYGFYDYYNKKCGTICLTVSLYDITSAKYSSSAKGFSVLKILNYSYVTDLDVDKNPNILKKYDKIIILHNEYVTKKEFDAITAHPNVIFLYPNALYAEVKTDYARNTITLVRGHQYPDPSIKNGFDWKYDDSKNEYNVECNDWNFYKKGNFTFLNCYPEYQLLHDQELLSELYSADPTRLFNDVSSWLRYADDKKSVEKLLDDYDITGNYIPSWVKQPASMLINRDVDRDDFANMINYLYNNHIIR